MEYLSGLDPLSNNPPLEGVDLIVIMNILMFAVVGVINPRNFITVIILTGSSIVGVVPFMYPPVDWAPSTVFDKSAGGLLAIFSTFSLVSRL